MSYVKKLYFSDLFLILLKIFSKSYGIMHLKLLCFLFVLLCFSNSFLLFSQYTFDLRSHLSFPRHEHFYITDLLNSPFFCTNSEYDMIKQKHSSSQFCIACLLCVWYHKNTQCPTFFCHYIFLSGFNEFYQSPIFFKNISQNPFLVSLHK